MARARSAKDSKDSRKESPQRRTKAPVIDAAVRGCDDGNPPAPWAEQLLALRERVDLLETRVNTLTAAGAADSGAHGADSPEIVDHPADAPTDAQADADQTAHAVPDADVASGAGLDIDDDQAGDHEPIDGDVPVGPTPAQLRARHGKPGGLWIVGAARLPRGVRATWSRDVATADILDRDWAAQADVLDALAHPVRLAVVREVLRGSRSVSSLAALPGVGTSGQLYHHIKPLLAAGWLRQDGRGRYEVPESRVLRLLTLIAALEA